MNDGRPPRGVPRSTRLPPHTQPHRPRWSQRLLASCIVLLEHALMATLRVRFTDDSKLILPLGPERVIFALWHNRLAFSMACYRKFLRRQDPSRRLAALISASRDGALLACTLDKFRVHPVRGSSSRRGAQALIELTRAARQGYDIAITPDGPRGPRYQVQEGLIALAQLTGLPILPVAICYHQKIRLRSWDRFEIPLPFTRCDVRICGPIRVPKSLDPAERPRFAQQIRDQLQSAGAVGDE